VSLFKSFSHRAAILSAAVGLGLASAARADEPSSKQLLDQINSLQAQVNELRAQLQKQPPQTQPATALPAAQPENSSAAVLRDADRRSQLLQLESLNAGWSRGRFLLQSEDGRYLLHPWFQLQFRNVTDYREDVKKGNRDDIQNGFEVRRLKFGFDGNVITTDLTYMLQFAVDRKSGTTQLEMAWAKYHLPDTPFSIRGGQFKDPVDHEQLLTSKFFVAPDRTLTNDYFVNSEGFVKGASLVYEGNAVHGEFAFTDGLKGSNQNFQDNPTNVADWGTAGRIEYKAFGDWQDYSHLSALDTKSNTLVFGAGADYTESGHTSALVHVVDGTFLSKSGFEIYAAYLGRYNRQLTVGKSTFDTYDWTGRLQASYVFDKHWEPFVQYEYLNFDHNELAAGSVTHVHAIRAGVNYFLFGHNAKLTGDVTYLPNGFPANDDGTGVLADNHHNEVVVRAQFQLLL